VGGDLTVKVEDNTLDGQGVYREDVDDPDQSLDDAQVEFAKLGRLIAIRVLPYREQTWRYLVFNTLTKGVKRIDSIGQDKVERVLPRFVDVEVAPSLIFHETDDRGSLHELTHKIVDCHPSGHNSSGGGPGGKIHNTVGDELFPPDGLFARGLLGRRLL
jgi:hypothetical protein